MTPTKLLIGQFFVVVILIIAGMWIATQYVAATLGYQARLGSPWFYAGDYPLYRPWNLFPWWYAYDAYAPDVFGRAGLIALSGGGMGIFAAVIGSLLRARQSGAVTTYGSARWANARDIKASGLIDPSGVFLGQYNKAYLRHAGPEHVMAFAPTRSGKGVGLVIPTLLTWQHSAVIHDIKGENWQLTAGWRAKLGTVLRFDPTREDSARYNPLLEVRKGTSEVRDVQNIADILVDPEGALERRTHWEKTAHALLTGVILHVLYVGADKSLSGVASLLADPARPIGFTLDSMLHTKHLGDRVHPVVAEAARELLNKSENERSGVVSTALSFLTLYRDPIVARATSVSDFRITDLMQGAKPLSLYLVVPPSDLSRTKPLVRLILNQIGRRLTEEHQSQTNGRRRCLLMLDEFPALGRLDFFESALAFMAGYGVRAYMIAQSLNQIEKAYGPNNAILDNCHVRVSFAANDERTAKRISDALGTSTELRSQKNYAGHRLAPWLAHVMVSRQETARPLMTAGEVMQMGEEEALVMIAGQPPIKAEKLRYYQDRNFIERLLPAPEEQKHIAVSNDWIVTENPTEGDSIKSSTNNVDDLEEGREPQPVLEQEATPQAPEVDDFDRLMGALDDLDDTDMPATETPPQTSNLIKAHAINEGVSDACISDASILDGDLADDLLPKF